MTKGLKVWLWIVLVINAIGAVFSLLGFLVAPIQTLISMALIVVFLVGVCLLLFKTQKLGFYLICGAQAASAVVNIITGAGVVASVVSAVLMPLITYLLMKSTWDQFN